MADVYVAQHIFQGASGVAKDEYVNTFHFELPVGDVADFPSLATAIRNFYWEIPSGGVVHIGSYLSEDVLHHDATIKIYRLLDAAHAPPVYTTTYDPLTVGGTLANDQTVPFEVACCLSYNALPEPGVAKGRLRGRIYIGPFNSGALGLDSRPVVGLTDTLRAAGAVLKTAVAGAGGFRWVVFSPTRTGGPTDTPICSPIRVLSTDDAWDTQRRRGNAPTARTLTPIGP